jgi:uncharacterized peroxidase-related enzyme
MPFLPSLPEDAIPSDLFRAFPEIPRAKLSEFTQAVMQGPSPFTEGKRELIGAYTSGLNGCRHCYRGHVLAAAQWGIDENLFEKLLDDIDTAPIDARMKPVLRYVRKRTETPSRLVQADADALYEAGGDERALLHAVAACTYLNFINRTVDGIGLMASEAQFRDVAKRLHDVGYAH